tara:strand:- start:2300 stop:3226 length:927 start_codon:yes stop_codon:yes gene_type:complete
MKNIFYIFLSYFLLNSCQFNNYETVEKNEFFRKGVSTGKFTKLENGYTYYETKNDDKKNTLVFIHGFSVPSYIWDKTYDSAANKGYKVVRLDLFGRGFSDNPNLDYSDELFANQVIQLLEKINVNKATFLGLSNGGRVISKIAYLKPGLVEKLVYVSSNSFKEHRSITENSVTGKEINDFIRNRYPTISNGQLLDFKYPENHQNWVTKYEDLLKYKGFARALVSTIKNHKNLDKENSFIDSSEIPYFLVWGDSDSTVVYKEFEKKLNKLMLRKKEYFIEDSGHLPNIENSIEFENLLFNKILINNFKQ